MISFICSECGGFGLASEESLDSGTQLTCDGCGKPTVVELFTPSGYKKRHDMELQIHEMRPIVEAAVAFVKWHGAGFLKNDERYDLLLLKAGNYHLAHGDTEKRVGE